MKENAHDKALKEVLQELIGGAGAVQPFAESLVAKYLQDSVARGQLLVKSGEKPEGIVDYYATARANTMDTVVQALLKSSEFKDSLYKKSYERLKALADGEDITWGDIFADEIYDDEQYLNEIFVRLVEEQEGVAITSAKQLQELTGITEVYGYANEEGETIPYGDKMPTKKEAQELAYRQVEDTFIKAMSYRYSKALDDILQAGGKYKDLLQVKPAYFNLPETWSGCLTSDQYSSILWAIEDTFLIGEPNTSVRPDLKTIAQEIEAPYSVLLDAHKLSNQWKLQS